jgi:hypothetical protein
MTDQAQLHIKNHNLKDIPIKIMDINDHLLIGLINQIRIDKISFKKSNKELNKS